MRIITVLFFFVIFSFETLAEMRPLDISDYEYYGKEIYKKDWLAWNGTDFLLDKNILQDDLNSMGWIVYALASTTESGVVVIGGHNKITTNQEGTKALKSEQTYSSCMNMNPSEGIPEGAKPAGLSVTDKQNQIPSETMVFLSLQHKLPLFVATTSNGKIWEVKNGKINEMEQ